MVIWHKKGFTLAEVLITLGIIGVVAAMTIPSLLTNTNDQEYTTRLKKKFSEISQAFDQIRADNGGTLQGVFLGTTASPNAMNPYILQYFNVADKAQTQNSVGNTVWSDPSKWFFLNSQPHTDTCSGCAGYKFNDGSFMYTNSDAVSTCNDRGISGLCMILYIDLNGIKTPNIIGKDIHVLYVYKDKTVPPDVPIPVDKIASDDEITHCDTSHLGFGCSKERLLNNL